MSGGRLLIKANRVRKPDESAVWRGWGGKEKERTDCVQSDVRTFGIAGDWKAVLEVEVWVEMVTEGGRRFVTPLRKDEVSAARYRQENIEATIVDEPKESCTGARWIETCVAPRHVDVSRDFLFYLLRTSSVGGVGGGFGGAARLSLFVLFLCSVDHSGIGQRINKVVFSGWQSIR